jgi:hypothetical protein
LGALHLFTFTSQDDQTTTLVQSEEFLGVLGSVFNAFAASDLRVAFQAMNERLKELAETRYREERNLAGALSTMS